MEIERRTVAMEVAELRIADAAVPRVIGYGGVFSARTDLGMFTEEIAPGAFDPVLGDDVRGLFNHHPDHVLGRTKSGTLRLSIDDRGLRYEIDLNPEDPDAMKLHARVKRGDISGSSFAFTVAEDSWDHSGKKQHRVIQRLGKLLDVGPVTFPAYQGAKVSARALELATREVPPAGPTRIYAHDRRRLDLLERE